MLIDARTLPADASIETDVCIVGAGPAGITMALELAEQDFRVCLLEGGKLDYDEATQALHQGELIANCRYPALDASRQRQYGGTAHMWEVTVDPTKPDASTGRLGARLLPLDDVDFEERSWIPYSGWPFSKADLDPYYKRAEKVCRLGSFDLEDWETKDAEQLTVSDRFKSIVVQHGTSALFTHQYRDKVFQASNITTYLGANVLEIETNNSASEVTSIRAASLDGKEFTVVAKMYVLAAGGIENARLLLQSNRVQPEGLGNSHDLVGRFFMDHPTVYAGLFVPRDRQIFNKTALYDLQVRNDVAMMARLTPTNEMVRQEQIQHAFAFLLPKPKGHWSKANRSLKTLLTSLKKGKLPKDALKHLATVVSGLDDIVANAYRQIFKVEDQGYRGWSGLSNKEKKFAVFAVYLTVEQAPHPDNRLTLSQDTDRFGRRKAKLEWRWGHDIDIASIKRIQTLLADQIQRSGLGEFQIHLEDNGKLLLSDSSAHHHIGTTRMHVDPQKGVVDPNCKVHGVSNLYITGCSVFPTGGYANPTFTIIAMAVRMADHVKHVMANSKVAVEN
jgi:choline dehydrogenase-like flavoprotein